jgi:hypothetical protein
MKVSELNALIENIVTTEVKKIISEQSEGKKEVYHIICDGEPVDTFNTEEEAQEHVDKLKQDHPGKQFIIEKAAYNSDEDMITKLDEMGDQLENETENMENTQMDEKLYGNQSKLDKNQNGKLDADDFKKLRNQTDEEEECDECGDGYMEEEWQNEEACPKCGKELCECGMGLYESADRKKKKKLRLKESELINLIKGMVSESLNGEPGTAGTPGVTFTKKAQQGSKKENEKAMADVDKKMKDYLNFDGNDNSEFPHQNGVATKKAAFNNTKEQDEEVAKNFAGLQNLDYDIEPSQQFKDRLKKAIEGHTTMGNAPTTEKASIKPSNGSEKGKEAKEKEGNHIQTPETAKKMNKQVKDRQKDKDARVLYNKESVPVNESQVKFKNILAEEINKMKTLSGYNKKTQ